MTRKCSKWQSKLWLRLCSPYRKASKLLIYRFFRQPHGLLRMTKSVIPSDAKESTRPSRGSPRSACTFSHTSIQGYRPNDDHTRIPTLSAWPGPRPSKRNLLRLWSQRHRQRPRRYALPYDRTLSCNSRRGRLPRARAYARKLRAPGSAPAEYLHS